MRGLGLSSDADGFFTSGLITSIEFDGLGIRQGTITNITWSAVDFQNALLDINDTSDTTAISALFSSSGPITIDASGGLGSFNQEITWEMLLPLLTQPIIFTGSPFADAVEGTTGNDVINAGLNVEEVDRIVASEGNDRIIFDVPEGVTPSGYSLDYDTIGAPVTFDINGITNFGSVSGAGFTDSLENVADALNAYLALEGTSQGDLYSVQLAPGQVISLIGGPGADTYNLSGDGAVPILDFLFSDATSGLDADLATGIIADDGFGFAETLDLSGTPDFLILYGTDNNDLVSGGPGNQLVRLYNGDDMLVADNSGEDSIDGGNGTDRVEFNDVAQGDVTLSFSGGISTLADRSDPGNSTALLDVEILQTQGGVQLELDKHDGIGLISAANLSALTELYIAYFDRAADALGLSFWATAFQNNGFTFQEIADLFFTQPETVALYSEVSDGEFVTAVYNNVLGRDPDPDGFAFWTAQLSSGNVSESSFILELLVGARAATGSPQDVAYIESKTDLGLYFSVIQGQSNLTAANAVMDAFDGTASSLIAAQALSDTALADAESSSTELLLPVLGVIDNPFADVAQDAQAKRNPDLEYGQKAGPNGLPVWHRLGIKTGLHAHLCSAISATAWRKRSSSSAIKLRRASRNLRSARVASNNARASEIGTMPATGMPRRKTA